jgi:hypothetical protein
MKMNEVSIERDRKVKQGKLKERERQEERVTKLCGPLLKVVARVLPKNDQKDLLTSLIAVLEQARHEAGVGLLCRELADQLLRAFEYATADIPAIEPNRLAAFTETLCTHKDFNNLQGDVSEITQAVRMAESKGRIGPVIIGSIDYEKDKEKNQKAQEIDVSFAGKDQDKDVLHLQEVAWDLGVLESKLLSPDKTSQREGYARVIKAQSNGSSREVRMTYVVHNARPEDLHAIQTNVAPKSLGTDLSDVVKVGEAGAMKTVLVKRGYYLSLGGKVFAPSDL